MRPAPSVLIVEDDYLLLTMLADLCERDGMRVLSASTGEAALTTLRARGAEVDWLFTDIALPGLIDGWTVAETYRALHPNKPVVYASAASRTDGRPVSGSVFLRKPLQMRDVVALVRIMSGPSSDVDSSRRAAS